MRTKWQKRPRTNIGRVLMTNGAYDEPAIYDLKSEDGRILATVRRSPGGYRYDIPSTGESGTCADIPLAKEAAKRRVTAWQTRRETLNSIGLKAGSSSK